MRIVRLVCAVWILLMQAILLCAEPSAGQITNNVMFRTFLIRSGEHLGSAFTIEVDGRQYLVTAKHVVEHLEEGSVSLLKLYKSDCGWTDLKVKVLKVPDPVDIAVLVPPAQLSYAYDLPASTEGLVLGEEVTIVGYPHGAGVHDVTSPNFMGFVKCSRVSQIECLGDSRVKIVLDGSVPAGFSGAPVVFRDHSKSGLSFKLAGVISVCEKEPVEVMKAVEPSKAEDLESRQPTYSLRGREKNTSSFQPIRSSC